MVNQSGATGSAASMGKATAVHRIARLTDEIAAGPEARSLTELARALDSPKSTVSDLCASLVEQRLLQRSTDGRYKLGVRFVEIVDHLLHEHGLVQLFAAQVRGSNALSGRTVFLSTKQDGDHVIIEVVHGDDPLPITPYPGLRSTSDGEPVLPRAADDIVVQRRGDAMTITSPIVRAAPTAPPVWATAVLPVSTSDVVAREVTAALERISTTLSIHGGATPNDVDDSSRAPGTR